MIHTITIHRGAKVEVVRQGYGSLNHAFGALVALAPWDDDTVTGWSVDPVHDPRVTFDLLDALQDYFGRPVSWSQVDVAPDPVRSASIWAINVREANGVPATQFLYHGSLSSWINADDLEEVQFTAWPPTVRQ